MGTLPPGATPVEAQASFGTFIKLAKPEDFLTGIIAGITEREDKYNPGKTQTIYSFRVEACQSHKREQDKMGNWVPSKDQQEVGDMASLSVTGDLRRKLAQLDTGSRVLIVYKGVKMVENKKTGAKVKAGDWEVYSLPTVEENVEAPF